MSVGPYTFDTSEESALTRLSAREMPVEWWVKAHALCGLFWAIRLWLERMHEIDARVRAR